MKDFNEIYQKVCLDVNSSKSSRKPEKLLGSKATIVFIIIGALIIFTSVMTNMYFLLIIALFIFGFVFLLINLSKKNKEYKETVIKSFVHNFDNNLQYNLYGSITRQMYNYAEFEGYDTFSSEDSIQGNLDGIVPINMSNVRTEIRSTDSDGNTTYTTVFSGLFAEITLSKPLNFNLFIHSDKGLFGKMFSGADKLNMDSQEFEKIFDVRASDKIKAMQILTSDVMADLIDFKNTTKNRFEITIKGNKLYFRYHCGDLFERAIFKDNLDFKTLESYFKYLNFTCEVSKKLYNLINETDI